MAHAKDRRAVTAADPRLLAVQAERAAKTIRTTLISSPFWAVFVAFITSDWVPYFGTVPVERAATLLGVVAGAFLAASFALRAYGRSRDAGLTPEASSQWLRRFLYVAVLLSSAWGLAPWMLWDESNSTNHVFVSLFCLAVIARFVVHRANHVQFFLGSFLPLTGLLAARLMVDFRAMEMILAAIVPLYAIQVVMDSRNISQRWDREAMTRFSLADISRDLEEARDEALAKRAEAEAANASKTSFLANMSHELRTPLNAILGFSDIISREYLGPVGSARYKEYAEDIYTSGTHLLSLINDLLDVAKIEAGRMEIEPERIATRQALDDALKYVGAKAREREQNLTIAVDESAEFLYADERALKQMVINLVSNAVKFTQEGGQIEVRVRRDANFDFELSVADNGPGIPESKINSVFKPFSRVDNRYEGKAGGTGLGLSLVHGLARLHGGRAWIESEEGKGTRVFVVLSQNAGQADERLRA
jgi:two-component system cell cycle sensor histidine kinase PleC